MEEDWGGADEGEEDSDEEMDRKKKGARPTDTSSRILTLFSGKAKSKAPKAPVRPPPQPTINAYRPAVSKEQENDFMASLLGELDAVPVDLPPPVSKSRKRKPSPSYRTSHSYADTSSDGPIDLNLSSDDLVFSPQKKIKTNGGGMTPAVERLQGLAVQSGSDDFDTSSYDDVDMDVFMADDPDIQIDDAMQVDEKKGPKKEPKKEEDTAASWLSVYDSLAVSAPDDVLGPLVASSTAPSTTISALEPDGSLRFFWLEYLENEGRLYFVGKLKDKVTGAWVSCCVTVENMQRNVFVLPRTKPDEFDEVPDMQDVYNDVDLLRKRTGIKAWKAKFVKRNYAFGEPDVPREETQWLKVVYGFNGKFS
jgi:DNA polymerase alpha subunit A